MIGGFLMSTLGRMGLVIGVIPAGGGYAFLMRPEASGRLMFFLIAVAAGIAFALLIANFAKMKGRRMEGRIPRPGRVEGEGRDLKSAVFNKLSSLPGSARKRQLAATAITGLFEEAVNKKVSLTRKDLGRKYETVIQEKDRAVEIINKKYKRLSSEKKQTEAIVRSIAEGLMVVNDKGEVLMMNPAAERLLGAKKEEKVGKSILSDLKEEQLISLVRETSGGEGREIEVSSAEDETKKVLRASSAVIEDEDGRTVGMVSVLTDVTKQKELERMKSNFVSNVSHELRTPIVAIQKSISVMLSRAAGTVSEAQERFLTIAKRNLERLSHLIDDILDLSRLDMGKVRMRLEPARVDALINESCDGLQTWAKSKGIRIERKIQQGLPEIPLDPDRIIQILNNIVGNAIKFTPSGGLVIVEAKLRKQDEMEISVTDNGVGIAKGDLEKVFDRFQQVGERVATDIGGTGLGLSIAKEIVEMHGGRIWAESEKGRGAKFTFTLPTRAT